MRKTKHRSGVWPFIPGPQHSRMPGYTVRLSVCSIINQSLIKVVIPQLLKEDIERTTDIYVQSIEWDWMIDIAHALEIVMSETLIWCTMCVLSRSYICCRCRYDHKFRNRQEAMTPIWAHACRFITKRVAMETVMQAKCPGKKQK